MRENEVYLFLISLAEKFYQKIKIKKLGPLVKKIFNRIPFYFPGYND